MVGNRIERGIQDHGFRDIFLEVNRQCFCWMDEWIDMSIDDMRNFEQECAIQQKRAVQRAPPALSISTNNSQCSSDDNKENQCQTAKNSKNQFQSSIKDTECKSSCYQKQAKCHESYQ